MANKPDRFMPVEIEPWLKKTARLSPAARGAYMDLLLAYWRGEALPADDDDALMRIARCTEKEWAPIRDKVLAYFKRDGDLLTQERADEEKAKAQQMYERKASSGKAGGLANAKQKASKTVAEPEADPLAEPKQTPTHLEHLVHSSIEESPVAPEGGRDVREDFAGEFERQIWPLVWSRGGANQPKKPARLKFISARKRGESLQEIVAGMRRYSANPANKIGTEYAKQLVTWLNAEGWKDCAISASAGAPDDPLPDGWVEEDAKWLTRLRGGAWHPGLWGPKDPGAPGFRIPLHVWRAWVEEQAESGELAAVA